MDVAKNGNKSQDEVGQPAEEVAKHDGNCELSCAGSEFVKLLRLCHRVPYRDIPLVRAVQIVQSPAVAESVGGRGNHDDKDEYDSQVEWENETAHPFFFRVTEVPAKNQPIHS